MNSRESARTLRRRTVIKPVLARDLRGRRIVRLIVVSLRSKLYTTPSARATVRLYNQIRRVESDSAQGWLGCYQFNYGRSSVYFFSPRRIRSRIVSARLEQKIEQNVAFVSGQVPTDVNFVREIWTRLKMSRRRSIRTIPGVVSHATETVVDRRQSVFFRFRWWSANIPKHEAERLLGPKSCKRQLIADLP